MSYHPNSRIGQEIVGNLRFKVGNFEHLARNDERNGAIRSNQVHLVREIPSTKDGERTSLQLISLRALLYLYKHKDDIGAFLIWDNPTKKTKGKNNLKLTVSFYLVNKNDEVVLRRPAYTCEFTHREPSWGYHATFCKADIEKMLEELLVDGSLTVGCEFRIFCDVPQEVSALTKDKQKEIQKARNDNLGKCLTTLREEEEFTDLTLVCQGVEIRCHRNVVVARSKVFRAMFNHKGMLAAVLKLE